jgi:hypothetical protein
VTALIRFIDGSEFEAETWKYAGDEAEGYTLMAEGRLTGYDGLNPGPTYKLEAPESSVLYVLPNGQGEAQ